MSILNNLINALGKDGNSEPKPCRNCPADCSVYPAACAECRPCKEKLTELLYDVEHLDAYYDRYEVVPAGTQSGTVNCPACGAPNPASAAACEFCGTQLREGSAKIQVASALDIPDPIQLAEDVIFERRAIEEKFSSGGGLLDSISDLLSGNTDAFGSRMTTDEVKTIAAEYNVTVAAYLQGLDNGTYLTASAKQKQDSAAQSAAAYAAPIAGAAANRPANDYRPRPRTDAPMRRPDPPRHDYRRPEPPHGPGRREAQYPPTPDRPGPNARRDRPEHGKPAPDFHGRPAHDRRDATPGPGKMRPGSHEKRGNPDGRPSGRGGNPSGRGGDRGRR